MLLNNKETIYTGAYLYEHIYLKEKVNSEFTVDSVTYKEKGRGDELIITVIKMNREVGIYQVYLLFILIFPVGHFSPIWEGTKLFSEKGRL